MTASWLLIAAVAVIVVMNIGWCLYATSLKAKIYHLEELNCELYETLRFYRAQDKQEVKT